MTLPHITNTKFIGTPVTINLEGVPLRGWRQRLRVLFGRPAATQSLSITDCLFVSGTPVPPGFLERIRLCTQILRGGIQAVGASTEPGITIMEVHP